LGGILPHKTSMERREAEEVLVEGWTEEGWRDGEGSGNVKQGRS